MSPDSISSDSRVETSNSGRKITVTACILLAVLVFTKILLRPFGGLDELWVYNLSRGIAMGYVPYKDFTMAIMPLFNVLFAVPLYIVRNLFVYRLSSALMLYVSGLLYYRIASRLTGEVWGLLASLLLVAFMDYATYNGLMVLLTFGVFILWQKLNMRNAVIVGVLSALTILCRQTSGVFLLIALLFWLAADKALRKFILPFLIGWGAVMTVFAACLLATGSFAAFWDCCFFSLLGSGDKNTGILADGIAVYIITVCGVAASVYLVRKNSDKTDKLHLVFGIILITIAIPIVDMMHMYYAAAWFLIPVLKLIKNSVSGSLLKIVIAFMSVAVLFINALELPQTTLDNRYEEFRLIPVRPSEIDYYEQIIGINSKYESEGKRVVLVSSGRCIISMMTGSYDPGYDLFMTGNFGTGSAVSRIEEEMDDPDVIFVIPDDYEVENWQNPHGVLSYIQENCTPVERFDAFVWYAPR